MKSWEAIRLMVEEGKKCRPKLTNKWLSWNKDMVAFVDHNNQPVGTVVIGYCDNPWEIYEEPIEPRKVTLRLWLNETREWGEFYLDDGERPDRDNENLHRTDWVKEVQIIKDKD